MIVLIATRRRIMRRFTQCQCGCGESFPRKHMVAVPSPFPGTRADTIYIHHAKEAGISLLNVKAV